MEALDKFIDKIRPVHIVSAIGLAVILWASTANGQPNSIGNGNVPPTPTGVPGLNHSNDSVTELPEAPVQSNLVDINGVPYTSQMVMASATELPFLGFGNIFPQNINISDRVQSDGSIRRTQNGDRLYFDVATGQYQSIPAELKRVSAGAPLTPAAPTVGMFDQTGVNNPGDQLVVVDNQGAELSRGLISSNLIKACIEATDPQGIQHNVCDPSSPEFGVFSNETNIRIVYYVGSTFISNPENGSNPYGTDKIQWDPVNRTIVAKFMAYYLPDGWIDGSNTFVTKGYTKYSFFARWPKAATRPVVVFTHTPTPTNTASPTATATETATPTMVDATATGIPVINRDEFVYLPMVEAPLSN